MDRKTEEIEILSKILDTAKVADDEEIKSTLIENEDRLRFLSDKIVTIQKEYESYTMEQVLEKFEVVIALEEDIPGDTMYRLFALCYLIENDNVQFNPRNSILNLI